MTAATYMKPAADVKRFAMRGSHTGNTHPKEIALTNPEESTVGTENNHVREVRTGDHAAETAALECWVDEDLSKSGLTRDDFEVVPFAPETTRDGHELNNGGYCIVYRNEDGTVKTQSIKPHSSSKMRMRRHWSLWTQSPQGMAPFPL